MTDLERELLAALKALLNGADILMVSLIKSDPTFMPTRSDAWPAIVDANAIIAKAEGREPQ